MRAAVRGTLSRAGLVLLAVCLVATTLLAGDRDVTSPDLVPAADLGQFNPGNIISDSIFFNGTAMDTRDVQTFLDLKGMGCRPGADGTPCLKDYSQDTTARAADAYCSGYGSPGRESAAVIIAKVASSCRINPQALLVILQKEQGLVLGSGRGLYASRYQKAMGFACPDTAACDAAYYGFQNQVYSAARQFQRYAAHPTSFGYRAGRTSDVGYYPAQVDPAKFNYQGKDCGSSPVYIQNQATAGLYIYTPYQPNGAALAAGYGTGDQCSAYGNRNFWLYFTDWFGGTQQAGQSAWQPVGALDAPTVSGRLVSVSGWAVDPDDVDGATTVHVYVDGQGVSVLRADQYSAQTGSYQGYATKLPLSVGGHRVCAYAINVGAGSQNTHLGCRDVTVGAALGDDPTGVVGAGVSGRSVQVSGWALDPSAVASPIDVHVYADGVGVAVLRADGAGAPTAAHFAGAGDRHSYSTSLVLGAGRHQVCSYGINVGAGTANTHLGCVSVLVDAAAFNPEAQWQSVSVSGANVVVSGWARDFDDAAAAIQVHAYVNGVGTVLVAGGPSDTVPGHGFSAAIPVGMGTHQVCLYAINIGQGTTNPHLGCQRVTLDPTAFNPVGALESVSAVGGAVSIAGYVSDPDVPGQGVQVHVYVDGSPRMAVTAAGPHPVSDGHGYTAGLTLTQGAHRVCTYAINVGYGTTNPGLGCKSVTVSANPVGTLESVTSLGSQVTVTGHVTDPDIPTQGALVHVHANGVPQLAVLADQPNAVAPGHGYATTFTLPEGVHTVCTYGINSGAGDTNTHLGCRSVTVSANPVGTLESVTSLGSQVTVTGHVTDPDIPTQGALVHVHANGVPQLAVLADQPHAVAPGHGYATTFTLPEGVHTVCTYGINSGAGDANTHLGCRSVTVSANPVGVLESVTAAGSQVTVTGHVMDPDAPNDPLQVHVYADGAPQLAVLADQPNPAAPGHGYVATFTLPPGARTVCTYGINVGAGTSNTHLGCQKVTVG